MFRDFMRLVRPFWTSNDRWKARGLLVTVMGLAIANVLMNLKFNTLTGSIFNALQEYNRRQFWQSVGAFAGLAFVYVFANVYQQYLQQLLGMRWRRWMTNDLLQRWLSDRTFYYWQVGGNHDEADNPDQRLTDDVRDLINSTLTLGFGFFQQALTLIGFVALLWKLSGPLRFVLGGAHVMIPGYMVWASLLYAGIGSWVTYRLGRPLIDLNFRQQRFEANFRFGLARLRENAESVAISHGEAAEQISDAARLSDVLANTLRVLLRQKLVGYFTIGYQQAAALFPMIASAPRYFAKEILIGQISQISDAFGQVQTALSYFITMFTDTTTSNIAYWGSTVRRLTSFGTAIEEAKTLAMQGPTLTARSDGQSTLDTEALTVRRPDGTTLLHDVALRLTPGRALLLSGPSGIGKSTLLRALVGAWPYASGHILRPEPFRALILPQKPYLPIGTLRAALDYPATEANAHNDNTLRNALNAVRLPQLADRLNDSENWSQILSPGEQQRVSLARAFVQKPDYLFLDEATSALDETTEAAVFRALRESLPNSALLSIGHRSTLIPLHEDHIAVNAAGELEVVKDSAG